MRDVVNINLQSRFYAHLTPPYCTQVA